MLAYELRDQIVRREQVAASGEGLTFDAVVQRDIAIILRRRGG